MRNERVSVIMPVYNGAKTVKLSIESILNQSFDDYKIYVVDDGSQDETSGVLEGLRKQFPDKLHIIYQPNQGQTKAKNHALKHVKGEFIALCDADDLWQRDKLKQQLTVFENNSKVGLCYTDGYYIDEKGNITGDVGITKRLSGECLQTIMMGNAIVASSVIFKSDLIAKVGNFDETLRACENWELWTRIASVSQLYALDDKLICYRQHQNNLSLNFKILRESRIKVIEKNAMQFNGIVPNIKQMTSDAKFKAYRFFGESYLWHLKTSEARKDLLKAIMIRPTSLVCYKLLIKSLLGAFVLSQIRKIRGVSLARQIT